MIQIDEILLWFKNIESRILNLEKSSQVKKIKIPPGGKLVVDSYSSDPPAENGRIIYRTDLHKLRVCENGTWKTITTS